MPLSRETIERRAVVTGVKASKKRHHLISEEELLALRIQVMPWIWRWWAVMLGIGLLVSCWFAWPSDSWTVRAIEAFVGVLAILFGAFGIRRTLSNLIDTYDAADFLRGTMDLIGEAVSNIDL